LSVGGDVTVTGVLTYEDVTNVDSIGIVTARSGVDVTGNISVSGTVDGRDVATDGIKLDGIAAGAEVNVQSDWNASSGDAHILNKPTIPTNTNQLTNGAGFITAAALASSFTKYTFAAGSGSGSTRTHTWTKPSSGSTAIVLIWGGGGGGSRDNSRGGGGAGSNCQLGIFALSDLGSTETITLGQGGAAASGLNVGSNGTNSTFGSHMTAYGGRGGNITGSSNSQHYSQGSTPFGMGGVSLGRYADFGQTIWSGGYGARAATASETGGNAIFGGAGGGSAESFNQSAGGTSLYGGNGGIGADFGTAGSGSAPGGGGGGGTNTSNAGAGGAGECWVLIF
jgi:hypothetical protein